MLQVLPYIIIILVIICLVLCYSQMSSAESMFVADGKRTVTLHYTTWCPHCTTMKPIWAQVKAATVGSGIVYKESDEDKTPTAGITSYPSIVMIDEHGNRRDYAGSANFEELRNWVVNT